MRTVRAILFAAALLLTCTPAHSSERGLVIRTGDLHAEPFIDAAKTGTLAPNQSVTILARKGGWLSVEAGGKRGWVRLLNVRLEPAKSSAAASNSGLRTGSRGRTLTTGVKGLEEGSILNAAIDRAQLAALDQLSTSENDARALALENGLKEATVAYLKPGKVK
jgi:Bacterial SH3 domain